MNFRKIVGKIGAVAAGCAALFLAGKSGLGESLFNGKDSVDTDDLEQGLQPTEPTEMTEETTETETVDTTATEGSD